MFANVARILSRIDRQRTAVVRCTCRGAWRRGATCALLILGVLWTAQHTAWLGRERVEDARPAHPSHPAADATSHLTQDEYVGRGENALLLSHNSRVQSGERHIVDDVSTVVPIQPETMDAWTRCAPNSAYLLRNPLLSGNNCTNFDAEAVKLERSFSALTVSFRITSDGRPTPGLLILGELKCVVNCTWGQPPTNPDATRSQRHMPARATARVFAQGHDACDGSYVLRFVGLEYMHASPNGRWDVSARVNYANYEHFATPGPNCTRRFPGISDFSIPDADTQRCSSVFKKFPLGLVVLCESVAISLDSALDGDRPSSEFPTTTTRGTSTPPDNMYNRRPHIVDTNSPAVTNEDAPICAGGNDHPGRWVVRPQGMPDPRLCRADAGSRGEQSTPAQSLGWTVDDTYVWCPWSCRLRTFDAEDFRSCFERKRLRRVLFIGDSRTRQLFRSLRSHLMADRNESDNIDASKKCRRNADTSCENLFIAHNTTFELLFTYGLYAQLDPPHVPPPCKHEFLNYTKYFSTRRGLQLDRGLDVVRDKFGGRGALSSEAIAAGAYDAVVFSEGLHALQPLLSDDDVDELVRAAIGLILEADVRRPRILVYHSIPAVLADSPSRPGRGGGTRDNTRIEAVSRRSIASAREMHPDILVLDLFGLTVGRGDRYYDGLHFGPRPSTPRDDDDTLLIGSESNLVLLNMLCND